MSPINDSEGRRSRFRRNRESEPQERDSADFNSQNPIETARDADHGSAPSDAPPWLGWGAEDVQPAQVNPELERLTAERDALAAERDALVIERDEARRESAHRAHEALEAAALDQSALVGGHVATVLRAAEAAVAQLREEAETRAQDIVRDAQQTSARMLDDATARMAAAQAEADNLVGRARLQAEEYVGAMSIDFDRLKEATQDLHRQLQQAREAAAFSGSGAQIPESHPSEPTAELRAARPSDESGDTGPLIAS